jgi:hypothetical protein
MLTALSFLVIVMILCVGVAFLDRKMVLAMSFDNTPTNALILRQRGQSVPAYVLNGSIQTTNNKLSTTTSTVPTIPDAFASTIPTTPEPRVSKYYDPPPFRLIQDDISGKFDNNRWEITHIVRNDSLRKKLEIVDGLRNQEGNNNRTRCSLYYSICVSHRILSIE